VTALFHTALAVKFAALDRAVKLYAVRRAIQLLAAVAVEVGDARDRALAR
jgi:hypothetical protein